MYHFSKFCMNSKTYEERPNASYYCIFFGAYKPKNKKAQSFGFIFVLSHFFIAMAIAFLYKNAVAQIIIILIICVILFLYTLAIRPFQFFLHWIIEIITQLLLIIGLICLTIAVGYDKSGCHECAGREGSLCYLMLFCFAAFLILLTLGLIIFSLMAGCIGLQHFFKKKEEKISLQGSEVHDDGDIYKENYNDFHITKDYENIDLQNQQVDYGHQSALGKIDNTTIYDQKEHNTGGFRHTEVHYDTVNQIQNTGMMDDNTTTNHVAVHQEMHDINNNATMNQFDLENGSQNLQNRNEQMTMNEFNKKQQMERHHNNYNENLNFDESHHIQSNYENVNQQGYYGSNKREIMDDTRTVKIDTDDDEVRMEGVLHALSRSDIGHDYEQNEIEVREMKRKLKLNQERKLYEENDSYESDNYHNKQGDGGSFYQRDIEMEDADHKNVLVKNMGGNYSDSDSDDVGGTFKNTNVVRTNVQSEVRQEYTTNTRQLQEDSDESGMAYKYKK